MSDPTLRATVAALGLHGSAPAAPGPQLFRTFLAKTEELLEACGARWTYIGAEGEGYTGRFSKAGGATHRRLVGTDLREVSVLSLVVNPQGSDEPAYDSYFSVSLSFFEPLRELTLACAANEALIPFGSSIYGKMLREFLRLWPWCAGYGFVDDASRQPDLYILGLDSGKLSSEEQRGLRGWYAASMEVKAKLLRDVFMVNVVGQHLAQELDKGITLRDFIERHSGSSLEQDSESGLHLWTITQSALPEMRQLLRAKGLIIGWAT